MSEVFEKIIETLEKKIKEYDKRIEGPYYFDEPDVKRELNNRARGIAQAIEIVKQAAAEYNNGWIPCDKGLPPQPEEKPTNADRIRFMSDEELAHLIAEKIECTECPFNGSEEKCGNIGCSKLFLEWLQSEAEVES